MGERLVMSVYRTREDFDYEGVPMITLYQHWGGYSKNAMNVVKFLLRAYLGREFMDSIELARYTIDVINADNGENFYLRSGKSGLDPNEETYASMYALPMAESRNAGLINITTTGMKDSISWAEETAEIFLDENTANIDGIWYWDNDKELIDSGYDDEQIEECRNSPIVNDICDDPTDVGIDDIEALEVFFDKTSCGRFELLEGGYDYMRVVE